ncbi:hypothetical protein [Archangium violaceum]|uniref:hypothetical protein n=1 Tax=Archangium violaceum TaxID=83451 RepID=UPI001362473B|nr:hypothetical protein [Archangium violaceum]
MNRGSQARMLSGPTRKASRADAWRVALEHGVDFLGADDLQGLDSFLEGAPWEAERGP